ncbi:Right handed beta helix region [Candidatus Methanoperedenaceae archaeon GB37]|nr:Right handed beta helix region [Candidatus Methanoperedenaceae archaeon GB37]
MVAKNRLILSCLAISLFVLLSLTNVSLPAYATTYYVDATNGNDFNNGLSPETAWKTISKVNSMDFKPGDTILFKRGEIWREQLIVPSSGTEGNPITFGAYGEGEKPIISAAEVAEGWTDPPNESNDEYSIYVGNPPEDADGLVRILIKDGEILEKVSSSQRFNLKDDQWTHYQGRIYYKPPVGHHPSEYKIEYGWRNAALRIENKSWINIENLRFEGSNAFDDNAIPSSLVHVEDSAHVNLDNCVSFYSSLKGITFKASSNSNITNSEVAWARAHGIGCSKNCSHIKISNCKVHDIGNLPWDNASWVDREGIAIGGNYGNSYITVEWCDVYNVGNDIADCNSCGLFFYGCDHCIAKYNKIHDNAKVGIMIADGGPQQYNLGQDTEIYYNLIYNNGWKSQSDDGSFGGLIVYIHNYQALDNLKIYNNTIVGNSQNSTNDTKNGGLVIRQIYDVTNDAPIYIKNNIIANNEGYELRVSIAGSLPNLVLDYNDYFCSSGVLIKWDSNTYTIAQFSTYQNKKNQDANSIAQTPLFIDAPNGNFHLQFNSLCINKGTDVGLTEDMEGNPVDYAPDIGAYEYSELNHTEIHVYSQSSSNPTPEILANGSDSPITLRQADTLTLTISLKNNGVIDNADWWLVKETPFGLYFFTFEGWTTDWLPGYQGPLFNLDSFEVLNMPASEFPVGTYTFYFCIDTNMDNNITWDSLYCDSIVINVTE